MTASQSHPVDNQRTAHQKSREEALGEISDVLLNLEHTLARSNKALARVRKNGGDAQIQLALTELIADLERNHKRFMQDTYYAGAAVKIF